jgi:phage gpG-like protein
MALEVGLRVSYQRAVRSLAKLGQSLDRTQLLNAIGLRWLQWIDENLRAGGTPAWPRMSVNTVTVNPRRASSRHFSSRYATRLRQSFAHQVSGNTVTVGTSDPFSQFHHFGSRPHLILPRNRQFLRFRVAGRAGGVVTVFARQVQHPGTPPRPLVPTKAVAERLAQRLLDAYVARKIQEAEQRL